MLRLICLVVFTVLGHNTKKKYPELVPILFAHLDKNYPDRVREGARALSVGGARTGWDKLVLYIMANGEPVAYVSDDGTPETKYFHKDQLGSITTIITNQNWATREKLSYDAWGKRRHGTDWWSAAATATEERGYTGHEHLDNVTLIHMNGRAYDPQLARFTSPDPFVPDPLYSQSYNRYAYVYANPLRYTDPSGFAPRDECIGRFSNCFPSPRPNLLLYPGTPPDDGFDFAGPSDWAHHFQQEAIREAELRAAYAVQMNYTLSMDHPAAKTDQEGLKPTSAFQQKFLEMLPQEHFQEALMEHLDARARLVEAMAPALRAAGGDRSTAGYRAMSEGMLERQLERLDREFFGYFEFPGYGIEQGPLEEFLGIGGIVRSVGRDLARSALAKLLLEKQLMSQVQVAEVLHTGGKVMAGGGVRKEIDDLPRLLDQYGGQASDWTKVTSSSWTKSGEWLETHAYRNIRTQEIVELKSKLP